MESITCYTSKTSLQVDWKGKNEQINKVSILRDPFRSGLFSHLLILSRLGTKKSKDSQIRRRCLCWSQDGFRAYFESRSILILMNIINCIRLNQQEECKMQIVAPLGPLQANSVFPVQKVSAHMGQWVSYGTIYGQWVSLEKGAKVSTN